ncbi:DUF4113 domain-containing protein [Buttiauxella warmboldiae]|uniref:DUF4113 domain-containing protein n=1 Tax=Buttiauxella warmboldiae TaxID=82993 RepID=UPI003CC54C88
MRPPKINSEALMQAIDSINKKSRGTLYFAEQGIEQPCQMKRAMLSPCYTTRVCEPHEVCHQSEYSCFVRHNR